MTARALLVAAGLAAGVALAFAFNELTLPEHRATATLGVAVSADPTGPPVQEAPLPAEVLAETYAVLLTQRSYLQQVQPQVRAGALTVGELAARLDARRPAGTALVELRADGPSEEEAVGLASDVAGAFVAGVQQLGRQRTAQLEDELRRRVEEVNRAIAALPEAGAGAAGAAERLASLRGERAALNGRLAETAVRGIELGASVTLVAPPAPDPGALRAPTLRNLLGGALLGLALGLGLATLRRGPRPAPVHAAVEPEPDPEPEPQPEPEPEPEPAPAPGLAVVLAEPAPGSTVSRRLHLRAAASGPVAHMHFLLSDGSAEWRELAAADEDGGAEWDAGSVEPGLYWLSALAVGPDGESVASHPRPLRVEAPPA